MILQPGFRRKARRTPGDRADPGSDRGVVPLTTTQSTAR